MTPRLKAWSDVDVEDLHKEYLEDKRRPAAIATLLGRSRKDVEEKIAELKLDLKADVEKAKRAGSLTLTAKSWPLAYRSHPPGKRFHQAALSARFILAVAGRRGGKTQAGGAEFVRRVLRDAAKKLLLSGPWQPGQGKEPKPFLRYAVVAPTYALLNEPKMALQRYLGGLVEAGGLIVTQGVTEWWLVGGIRIDFRSGDRPERLVSHGYDGIWLDEAARLKANVWAENIRATLSDTMGWALFTSTPMGRNWLWREVWAKVDRKAAEEVAKLEDKQVEDVLDPSYAGVTWTTAENTALPHLASEMEQARRELPEEQFARNYLASFDVFPGQVFRLVPERHLVGGLADPNRYKRFRAGIDIGSDHPTVITLWGELADGTAWEEIDTIAGSGVLFDDSDDWRGPGQMWTARARDMFKRYLGDWRRVSFKFPHDRPDVREQFEARGFNVELAYQGHEEAIAWCQTAFHCGRLKVRTSAMWTCLLAIRRPEPGKRSTKAWIDKDDDHWDAMRYALSEEIAPGGSSPTGRSMSAMGWVRR